MWKVFRKRNTSTWKIRCTVPRSTWKSWKDVIRKELDNVYQCVHRCNTILKIRQKCSYYSHEKWNRILRWVVLPLVATAVRGCIALSFAFQFWLWMALYFDNLRRFALVARANQGLELPSVRRWWYPRLRYRRKEETSQTGHIQGRLSNCSISCSDKKRIISEVKESHSEERIHIRTPSSARPGSLPDPTKFQTPRTNPSMDGERANESGQSLT